MKRYRILATLVAFSLLLLLVWPRNGRHAGKPENSDVPKQDLAAEDLSKQPDRAAAEVEPLKTIAEPTVAPTNPDDQYLQVVYKADESANAPMAFYGLVLDQDSNALQQVSVDLEIIQEWSEPLLEGKTKIFPLQRQTGTDGRFEIVDSGLRGKYVLIKALGKAGYEQEVPGQRCGMFGSQSTSLDNPAVLRMWSTNMHEPLISGEKSLGLVPDGRHYAIDLMEGTMTEGEMGDLVVWIKRPEKVEKGQRFDWDCELAIPNGGLLESQSQAMFMAPEAGYTNLFAFQAQASQNGPGSLQDQAFYVQLRNGKMYGRIVISLYPAFHWTETGLVRISYAVNPSGSRLLR